jgi:RNA polymerase sigma-70 factor (ECF subfamily)
MLILRDVLGWPAAEVAELLGTTTTAVNSGLRRARAQLARVLPAEDDTAEPNDPAQRAVLDRFAAALQNGDTDALAELLRKDVMLEMPPLPGWFAGRDMVRDFFAAQVLTGPGLFRLVPTAANGQPAFAAYQRGPGGVWRAHAVIVLDLSPAGTARIVIFLDPVLFSRFGLPHLRS